MWETLPFIGRGDELAALERVLTALPAAKPAVVLVGGPGGIGKSRLLDEFAGLAERAQVRVLLGRAREDVRAPFGPLVEALREHREALLARAGENAATLQGFLRSRGRGAKREAGDGDRFALFLALSDALLGAARDRPTLLILDDLHWFDSDSLEAFEHLAFAALHPRSEARLAIVATHREAEPNERLARALARLSREGRCHRLELGGLDEAGARELIQNVGGARPANQLVARLRGETGGNPLFMKEIVRHLVREGGLERRGGYLTASGELKLPVDVTAAIAARVAALPAPCRNALVTAALLGESFSLATLASLLDEKEESILELLDAAESAGLVESRGQSYRFSHPIVRFACERRATRVRRERMHAELARRLAESEGADEGERLFAIAHHWQQAGEAADAETRVSWARRAADRAVELCAWAEAARFYEAAAGASEGVRGLAPADRAELHYRAGYYFHRDWDAGPCVHHHRCALELYRRAGETAGVVRVQKELVRASFTLSARDLDPRAEAEALESELERLGDRDPSLRARSLDALATHYWTTRGGAARAAALANEAMSLARAQGDDQLAAEIAGVVALIHLAEPDVQRALDAWQRGAEDARRAGDSHRAAQALFRVPMAELQLGRLERTRAAVRAARALDREVGNPEVALAFAAEASEACLRGELDAAEAVAMESLQRIHRSGYTWPRGAALGALACARALRGDFAAARDAVALLTDPEAGDAEVARQSRGARILAMLVEALELGEQPQPAGPVQPVLAARTGAYDVALLPLFCAQVDSAVLSGRSELARGMRIPLELAEQRGIVFTFGWAFSVPRVLALACAVDAQGEPRQLLERAREQAQQSGARVERTRASLDLAHLVAVEDPATARRLLREACAEIRELSLWGLGRWASGVASELGEPFELGEAAGAGADVTLLDRLALGRSDAEIGRELALAPATVARRRDQALARIGAGSRAEAVGWAVERGVGEAADQLRSALEGFVAGAAERGALVIAVTDLEGSTALLERLGDAAMRDLLRVHNSKMRSCTREHGGLEIQHTGDGFILAFHTAPAAIAWALDVQKRFARRGPLRVRIGLHAGHALPEEGRLVGLAMNTAARVCSAATPGEVLVSENVRRLLGRRAARFGRGRRVSLKGRSDRLALYPLTQSR